MAGKFGAGRSAVNVPQHVARDPIDNVLQGIRSADAYPVELHGAMCQQIGFDLRPVRQVIRNEFFGTHFVQPDNKGQCCGSDCGLRFHILGE